ncbi:MAG: hypothetical protein V3U76_04430 [Granulosicoccus sp.]
MNISQLPRLILLATCISGTAVADVTPLELKITGTNFDIEKSLELSDIGEGKTDIQFDFKDSNGQAYSFDLRYVALPDNRSYPGNLDITVKEAEGEKLGYLFWANNGVAALKKTGVIGFVTDVKGEAMDVRLTFDKMKQGDLRVASLGDERLVQDTLISKLGFQMIRPVLLPLAEDGVRSQTYKLDDHPYAVNYTLRDIDAGNVEFQFNLSRTDGEEAHLLQRIYYHADSLETLREGMFAGKFFDSEVGTVKLVYYPTLGQTAPPE